MRDLIAYIAVAVVAFIAGLLWAGRGETPSSAEHAAALSALESARDSLTRLPAVEVRYDTVVRPGEAVVRIIRQPAERITDTLIRTIPAVFNRIPIDLT